MTNSTVEQAGKAIYIADAPSIPGLTFRHFAGESDFPKMIEVLESSRLADGIEEVGTLEDLIRRYSNLKNSDPYRDMLMIEVDGKLVGYNRVVWWEEELDGTLVYSHVTFLLPRWRGKGLERVLIQWAEARLREYALEHSAQANKLLDSGANDTQKDLIEALRSEGYEPVRYFYDMVRPDLENLPKAQLPNGIEVRPVDKTNREQMHRIWAAEVEAFKDHWGEAESDESDFDRWDSWGNFQPELWQVAWEGDEVVGMVRNYISDEVNTRQSIKRGYTENISVRQAWRKRGVARALIARSFRMLKDMGMTEAALGVDATNPSGAYQLYESMGFSVVKQGATYRKPMGPDKAAEE